MSSPKQVDGANQRALRAQALMLAVQNREPADTSDGEPQIKRAKRYLDFLAGEKALIKRARRT